MDFKKIAWKFVQVLNLVLSVLIMFNQENYTLIFKKFKHQVNVNFFLKHHGKPFQS